MLLSTKPPKCRHCKRRLTDMRQRLHEECQDAWIASQLPKLQAARERAAKRAAEKAKREEREQTQVRKDAIKKLHLLEAECREIVQKIARIRDRHDGCISCHMGPNYDGIWHGSHFRPAGNHGAVQFHLWNINKSCEQCNLFKGGNLAAYRPRLVEKIGADRVEWLESQNQPVKYTRDYLLRFKQVMGKRARRMAKSAARD